GPLKTGVKRLCIAVEDHSLDYADFEGEIPSGQYGAGWVEIWDKGEYELIARDKDVIKFKAYGKKLHGIYVLYRFQKAGKNSWLLFKVAD
ncbi:MAG: DNA polymerase ligase N-terminal domain-containing protein, partial [candidate division WOR-3 bacterium]